MSGLSVFGARLDLGYAIAFAALGALLAVYAAVGLDVAWPFAVPLGLLLAVLEGVVCRSAEHIARATPLKTAGIRGTLSTFAAASATVGAAFAALATAGVGLLGDLPFEELLDGAPSFFAIGAGAYLVAAVFFYATAARRETQRYETRALEAELLAKDAELRALAAKVNPHFLFNALNSVAALTASDPPAGRRMCLDLAELMRAQLGVGDTRLIPFDEEMAIARRYLAIEAVRFGDRMAVVERIGEGCGAWPVPPLVVQALVENAVKHGIGPSAEPGDVAIEARVEGDRLVIAVENSLPERPASRARRGGVGLELCRRRLETTYAGRARLAAKAEGGRFRAEIGIPKEEGEMSVSNETLQAIIADDERLAREYLAELLATRSDVRVVAACKDGVEALKAAAAHKPDVLFLDIQMPRLDGFEVLELLDREVAVVFVTAYDAYAVKAFDAHAVDYLLKPYSAERLGAAIDKVRRRLGERPAVDTAELRQAVAPDTAPVDRIAIKDGAEIAVVAVADVDYVLAEDDYVCIHAGGASHLKHQTMASLERALDPRRFVRIHRSCIANVERVVRVEPETKERFTVYLKDGTALTASREGMRRLREILAL